MSSMTFGDLRILIGRNYQTTRTLKISKEIDLGNPNNLSFVVDDSLKQRSGKYQVTYASVHLSAVRYLLIYEAMQRNGSISLWGATRLGQWKATHNVLL